MFTRLEVRDKFTGEAAAPHTGPEWLSRLRSLDGLFRKLILWVFVFCVLGVIASNTVATPAR